MNILTITLNPAFDLHYYIDEYRPYRESYANDFECNVGGKGINISRALLVENIENTAFVLVGKENSDTYISSLQSEDISAVPLLVDGRIRENLTIHEKDKAETRISLDNFSLSPKAITALFNEIKHSVSENTIILYSGRIPKGIPHERLIEFFKHLKALGAKICIDSNSFTISDFEELVPWLVKFNADEADNISPGNGHGNNRYALLYKLSEIGIPHSMISDGANDLLYSGEFDCKVTPPTISAVSTIGSGDCLAAGFIAAYTRGEKIENCLKTAVAYGSASCLRHGTLPPLKEDIDKLYPLIKISLF